VPPLVLPEAPLLLFSPEVPPLVLSPDVLPDVPPLVLPEAPPLVLPLLALPELPFGWPELEAVEKPGVPVEPPPGTPEASPFFPCSGEPDGPAGPALNGQLLESAQSASPHDSAGVAGTGIVVAIPARMAIVIVAEQPARAAFVFMGYPLQDQPDPASPAEGRAVRW
jgi:hypothetical protein